MVKKKIFIKERHQPNNYANGINYRYKNKR